MKTYKDTTTGEIWTEEEIKEIFEQFGNEIYDADGNVKFDNLDDYLDDRLNNGFLEEV